MILQQACKVALGFPFYRDVNIYVSWTSRKEEQGFEPSAVCAKALTLNHYYTAEVSSGQSLDFL